jgi:isocitrate/isopropylmalate dehydrogenase
MQILVLPGDGIGPEITAATLAVLRAASDRFGLGLKLEEDVVGHASLRRYATTVRPDVLAAAQKADGLILGPAATADFKDAAHGEINPSMFFRKNLDCSRTFARRARIRECEAPSAHSTSWSCGRTPKVSTPTATWSWAAARSW